MRQYGPPAVLRFETTRLPPLPPNDIRIRTMAAAINHTDLKIRAGNWPIAKVAPFPYVPGVEMVGAIEAIGESVTGLRVGQRVITMMQGLGGVRAWRPGAYAEYVDVAEGSIAPLPGDIDILQIAALGLAAVTAFHGLERICTLTNRRILVTGAAGGVGSAATAIASATGAEVVALITRQEQEEHVRRLGARDVIVIPKGDDLPLGQNQFDDVLDTVGGVLFPKLCAALRPEGRLSLVGAVGGGNVGFDAWHLIKPIVLTGYSTESLDGDPLRLAIDMIVSAVLSGKLASIPYRTLPLRDAALGHQQLESGQESARFLLVPGQ